MNKGQTVKGGLDVNIPNALSILRILLTPLFAALYLRGQTGAAGGGVVPGPLRGEPVRTLAPPLAHVTGAGQGLGDGAE